MTDSNCIFCRIASGSLPSSTVFEDENCLAFLDIRPLAHGHLLLVPKQHFTFVHEMPIKVASAVMSHLPRLGEALMDQTLAEGYNVLQNNGRAAGQEVMHVHFHLIPRVADDGLGYRWNPIGITEDERNQVLAGYRRLLGS